MPSITTTTTPSPSPGCTASSTPERSRPDTSTGAASPKSKPTTSRDTASVTFSQESEAGRSPSSGLVSRQTLLFGPDHVPVSHSRQQGTGRALPTIVTSGPSSAVSFHSAALQSCLENRLRVRMAAYGSPEYELKWKHWDTDLGRPICALRASARHKPVNDCFGWPAPNAMGGGAKCRSGKRRGELLIGGLVAGLSAAGTQGSVGLNPALHRWLMGFPTAWDACADTAMRSFRRSPRSSSRRTTKQPKT